MHIVAIVAHPDDADIFCGGTLAKHANRGDRVTIAHMTKGEYGGLDRTEETIASVRKEETIKSGTTLGADEVTFLGFRDGRITYSLENRLRIVDTIREYAPDVILTHFRDDMHPDHRVTARLVTDAYYMSSLPLAETDHPAHDPDNVYYFGKPTSAFEPTMFVDVSDHIEQKIEAIDRHESQVEFLQRHGGIDSEFDNLTDGIRSEARVHGKRTGVEYAEGFKPHHQSAQQYLDS